MCIKILNNNGWIQSSHWKCMHIGIKLHFSYQIYENLRKIQQIFGSISLKDCCFHLFWRFVTHTILQEKNNEGQTLLALIAVNRWAGNLFYPIFYKIPSNLLILPHFWPKFFFQQTFLKVPKCEIFHRLYFHDFYSMKPFWRAHSVHAVPDPEAQRVHKGQSMHVRKSKLLKYLKQQKI